MRAFAILWSPQMTLSDLTIFGVFGRVASRKLKNGRGDRIRTCDPLVPNQMRYQAAPLPDIF